MHEKSDDEIALESIFNIRLQALRDALTAAQSDNERLRKENSIFRTTVFLDASAELITRKHLEEFRSIWTARPVEECLAALDILEKHTAILAEINALKRRTILKKEVAGRDAALVKDAEQERKNQQNKKDEKRIKLSPREKLIKDLMSKLKCSREIAEKQIDLMMAGVKK